MKRRRRGVVVDPSALSRKQARRKAEEKLKTVALQRDPERLNGSLNVSSPHPPSFQRFLPSLRGERRVTFTKWEFSSDGIRAEVDNRLSRIPNYVVIFSLPHYKMQFEGIMRLSFISSLSLERERGWKRCGIEYVSYRGISQDAFASLPCVPFARLDLRARAASPGQGFGNEVFSGQRWKSAGGGHWPRLAAREVEKGRRDALLKFATLSVASLRLIKNCAGLCASLFFRRWPRKLHTRNY